MTATKNAATGSRARRPSKRKTKPLSPEERHHLIEVAAYLKAERTGVLKRRAERLWESFKSCKLCPRGCGVNRIKGEKGICSSTAKLIVHSVGPHFGEERPLVGKGGSGTVFFSACNLLCCFCQNWEINHRGDGERTSLEELADMMLALQRRGCHNINLVTPSHVVPQIVSAVRIAFHCLQADSLQWFGNVRIVSSNRIVRCVTSAMRLRRSRIRISQSGT